MFNYRLGFQLINYKNIAIDYKNIVNNYKNTVKIKTIEVAFKSIFNLFYFDISKAFDKVLHFGLIFKLINLGFEKYMIKFILNFLHIGTFRIKINEIEGLRFPIKCGIPQS